MKKLIFLLLILTASVCWGQSTVPMSGLPVDVSPGDNDNLIGYSAPGGTGSSKRFPLVNLKSYFLAGSSGGTVTSVGLAVPSFLTVANSPITTSGILSLSYSGTPLPIANGGTGTTTPGLIAGSNITLTGSWPNQTVNSTGTGYSTVQNAGTPLTERSTINFIGASVASSDNSGASRTDVTVTGLAESGFIADGGGSVIPTGLRIKRVMKYACTIVGWSIVADQSGSITMDIRKGTPSGGSVTTTTITGSSTPALSGVQVASSSSLAGWTTSVAAGDVLEMVVTGTPATVTQANITLQLTR